MRKILVIAVVALLIAAPLAIRRALRASATQVHRIGQ